MIHDINDPASPSTHHADLCIVGSGALGISAAREFIGTSHSVIVLEGGGQSFEQKSQEPYQSDVVGLGHTGIHIGRARVLGGTTTLWAGQALPLFEVDFKKRDWVPFSGWPIERSALVDYYPRAQRVMQLPMVSYDRATWPSATPPPEYDADAITPYFSQFAAVPDFAVKYRQELEAAGNVTVLTHANAVCVSANADANAIQEIRVKSFDGKQCVVRAKMFLLCCGGIETARLLLASDNVEKTGVGNSRDVVGRFFQDHPGVAIPVRVLDKRKFGSWYNSFKKGNVRHSIKLAASESLQCKREMLNTGCEVFYPATEDDPIASAKLVLQAMRKTHLRSQLPGALVKVLKRPDKVMKAAVRHYVLKQVASVNSGTPHIGFSVEQMPNPQSRVMLGAKIDSLGMRRTTLDWRVTAAEGRSISIFAEAVAREWRRLGVAEFNPADLKIQGREHGENGGYIDASHHMGTTRMGTDPASSVVDLSCKVHGYDNLYIGSSSVFPTGGFSNPTLTALALCFRICDQIKHRLGAGIDGPL
jgi:choline dehydrogenase-like flavoprotein